MQKFTVQKSTVQPQRRSLRLSLLVLLLSSVGLAASFLISRAVPPTLGPQLLWVAVATAIIGLVSLRTRGKA